MSLLYLGKRTHIRLEAGGDKQATVEVY